jgi:hypothetical protein
MNDTMVRVKDYRIYKRTFEGKTDPAKNDHALTSKYMPSYKYIAFFTDEYNDNDHIEQEAHQCYVTKQDAIEDMEFKSKWRYV